jgi:hypothetical protein
MAIEKTNKEAQESTEEQPQIGLDSIAKVGGESMTPTDEHAAGHVDAEETTMSTQARQWTSKPKFEQSDLAFPKLRLAQGTTAEVQKEIAKSGDFLLTGFDAVPSVVIIPLLTAKAREYRNKDDVRQILCSSIDAVTGVGTPGGICADCPKAEWTGPREARRPPPCDLVWSYVAYSLQHEQLVVVEFKKTGAPQAKFINTMLENRGPGTFAVNLAAQRKTNSRQQTYFEPVVTVAKVDQDDFQRAMNALAR